MEIMLIRHGKSERTDLPKLTVNDYKLWKEEYDRLGVIESESKMFIEASKNISRAEYVFTSSLYRSQHSLNLLSPGKIATPSDVFNEVNFRPPYVRGITLKSKIWTFVTGASWYWGLIKEYETKVQVKERAITASDLLIRASEEGIVALVGHGFFNLYILKELKRRGWKELNKYSTKNWSCTRLELLRCT